MFSIWCVSMPTWGVPSLEPRVLGIAEIALCNPT